MSSQSRNNKGKKQKNNRKGRTMDSHPRQIRSNIELVHRYRFTSTNAAATFISGVDLAGAAGSICVVTNSSVASIAQSLKLLEIEIFAPPTTQGTSSTCSVEWLGGGNGSAVEISDTSNSVAFPAHVRTGPPANSLAAFWQSPVSVNNILARVVAPIGSIIDCVMKILLTDDAAQGPRIAVATGVLGQQYYLALDSNDQYIPVSLTTTI